ncbi:glycoside hydrolase superfamily [Tribonema minus]|uniref:Glycoside hydrolase superfamily n=1 Tax=Tribonema minus TaxID=303371 RepID=A0A836CGL5_9STRA|nr:glycoside hydrolase superfamily [Tribonema minus]
MQNGLDGDFQAYKSSDLTVQDARILRELAPDDATAAPTGAPTMAPSAAPTAIALVPPIKAIVKPAPRGPLMIGLSDNMLPVARQAELGAKFQAVVKFQSVQKMRYPFLVKPHLDAGFQSVMVMEFLDATRHTNLKQIANGLYDKYLYKFVDELMDDGNREVWVRPLHEFNGDWYPWGTYRGGDNTKRMFKRAWRHVHWILTNKGANIKFQLAYNCVNGQNDQTTPFLDWWPGEQYVDMVVCSGYNRAGSDADHQQWLTFPEVFGAAYEQMLTLPGMKPLGVGETSCNNFEDNDKAQWIRDAFYDFVNTYPRIEHVTWFLQNKNDGRWDLNSPEEIAAFGESLIEYTPQNIPQDLPPLPPQADINGDGVINGDDAPVEAPPDPNL